MRDCTASVGVVETARSRDACCVGSHPERERATCAEWHAGTWPLLVDRDDTDGSPVEPFDTHAATRFAMDERCYILARTVEKPGSDAEVCTGTSLTRRALKSRVVEPLVVAHDQDEVPLSPEFPNTRPVSPSPSSSVHTGRVQCLKFRPSHRCDTRDGPRRSRSPSAPEYLPRSPRTRQRCPVVSIRAILRVRGVPHLRVDDCIAKHPRVARVGHRRRRRGHARARTHRRCRHQQPRRAPRSAPWFPSRRRRPRPRRPRPPGQFSPREFDAS